MEWAFLCSLDRPKLCCCCVDHPGLWDKRSYVCDINTRNPLQPQDHLILIRSFTGHRHCPSSADLVESLSCRRGGVYHIRHPDAHDFTPARPSKELVKPRYYPGYTAKNLS